MIVLEPRLVLRREESRVMTETPIESLLGERGIAAEAPESPAPSSNGNHPLEPRRTRSQVVRAALSNLGPRRISAVYLFAVFFVIFTALNPDTFPTSAT